MRFSTHWSRALLGLLMSVALFGVVTVPVSKVAAIGCGDTPELAAPAVQSRELWRYVYDGAGSYQMVDWNPTEVTLLVNAPGCALSTIGMISLDPATGQERWRITSDQWEGQAGVPAVSDGLVIFPTSDAIYAFDETTGEQLWSYGHGFDWAPEIVAIENNIIVLDYEGSLTGLGLGVGSLEWQQMLPVGSISDWESVPGGPLVALGRPDTAGQDVQAFGIDTQTGSLLWQTAVGQTVASTGGDIDLDGNGNGVLVATVLTDGTSELVALTPATGAITWTSPTLDLTHGYAHTFVTSGPQPAVVFATGGPLDVKQATGFDAISGGQRWQSEFIGSDAILVDDIHLLGAGPTLSFMNALVSVDAESGEMVWSQPGVLVDGGFTGQADVTGNTLVMTPYRENAAPLVLGVDIPSGNVVWSTEYSEFAQVSLDGIASGIALVTGQNDTEAVLLGLTS